MALPDSRGNLQATDSAAAAQAVESALWRMMSFYDPPIADLDRAIEADPHWALPHVMKAGFLLSLTEPALGAKDVLIEVRAASLNPIDYKIREGKVKLALPLKPPLTITSPFGRRRLRIATPRAARPGAAGARNCRPTAPRSRSGRSRAAPARR